MAREPWLTDAQQRVWRDFLQVSGQLHERLERELQQAAGMPHAYYQILAMLSEAEGRRLRMSQLAHVLRASQSRTSHAVNRLEEAGWVRREPTPEDGRGQTAVLTDAGWDRLVEVAPGHAESVRSIMFDGLTETETQKFGAVLDKILQRMGPESPDCP
ncbi:MarR family transcriptional regulator [Nakamurella silvestris]|nr:MarR family transcriptional regulator [Nakamurella silvestris]